ncbi:hypothetical protein MRX96_028799 [Rhipicephalus microplus]
MPNCARKFSTLLKFGQVTEKMCCAAQGVVAATAGYVSRAERDRKPAVTAMQQLDIKAAFDRYNFYQWRHALRVPQIIATADKDICRSQRKSATDSATKRRCNTNTSDRDGDYGAVGIT